LIATGINKGIVALLNILPTLPGCSVQCSAPPLFTYLILHKKIVIHLTHVQGMLDFFDWR